MLHDQRITAAGQYPRAVLLSCINSAPGGVHLRRRPRRPVQRPHRRQHRGRRPRGQHGIRLPSVRAKLVVVMGHTNCGAIKGACDHVQLGNLTGLLDKIQPAVQAVQDVPGARNSKNKEFVEAVAEANVRLTVARIRELSPILRAWKTRAKSRLSAAFTTSKPAGFVGWRLNRVTPNRRVEFPRWFLRQPRDRLDDGLLIDFPGTPPREHFPLIANLRACPAKPHAASPEGRNTRLSRSAQDRHKAPLWPASTIHALLPRSSWHSSHFDSLEVMNTFSSSCWALRGFIALHFDDTREDLQEKNLRGSMEPSISVSLFPRNRAGN